MQTVSTMGRQCLLGADSVYRLHGCFLLNPSEHTTITSKELFGFATPTSVKLYYCYVVVFLFLDMGPFRGRRYYGVGCRLEGFYGRFS